MIRALLIDDERLALRQMEKLLANTEGFWVAAACDNPAQAVEAAKKHQPDAVFLDIHMPDMNGLEAAERIHQVSPGSDIVFVTAYDAYALEAFEHNALDYILKPIQRERFMKTVRKLKERLILKAAATRQAGPYRIRTFKSIGYDRGDGHQQSFRWRTAKAQELFAYLLHNRNQVVGKEALLEVLWPESDPKKGMTQLYTTVYQVRQCLKQAPLPEVQILNVSGKDAYILEIGPSALDVEEWEHGIRRLSPVSLENVSEYQRLFELYNGDYLGDCHYGWAENERERLRTIWLHHTAQLAYFYADRGKVVEAVTAYKKLVELQPYYEAGYWGLMKVYYQMGDRTALEACYRELYERVVVELGARLPADIVHWYQNSSPRIQSI